MYFEWDEKKNKINLEKHGILFEDAVKVFDDTDKIVSFNRIVAHELRMQIIGEIKNLVVVMVIFTLRGENSRIISARLASKKERQVYYEKSN